MSHLLDLIVFMTASYDESDINFPSVHAKITHLCLQSYVVVDMAIVEYITTEVVRGVACMVHDTLHQL